MQLVVDVESSSHDLPDACQEGERSAALPRLVTLSGENAAISAKEPAAHTSIVTTLNIYTHVVDASHRKAIEAVERELFPTVPKSPNSLAAAKPVSDAVN